MKDIQLEAYSLSLKGLTNKEIAKILSTSNLRVTRKMAKSLIAAEDIKAGYLSIITIHKDWRLPTIEELSTLVDYSKREPACTLKDAESYHIHWSSTTAADRLERAWTIGFCYGGSSYDRKFVKYNVRFVREGEDGLQWTRVYDRMPWNEAVEFAKTLETEVYYYEDRRS